MRERVSVDRCARVGASVPVRSGVVLIATLLVGIVFTGTAQAAPGGLDPTFSGDGKQTTDFGHGADAAGGMALAPHGKIVAVGQTGTGGYNWALARYNPPGALDPTFSGDGKQTTDFGGEPGIDVATAVAMQTDGKIVAVGRGGPGGSFALARYKPNGSLDPTFSGDGKLTTNFGQFSDVAEGVVIQPNGKIVAVGSVGTTGGQDFALARYNPNGALDPTFSGDGKQTTGFGRFDGAQGMAIQPDGKIVAAGFALDGDFGLARYNPNGALDPTFSGDGKQTTGFGRFDGAQGMAIQPDGKIVAAG